MPALPANTITPHRAIKNYQLKDLINLRYAALDLGPPGVGVNLQALRAHSVELGAGPSTGAQVSLGRVRGQPVEQMLAQRLVDLVELAGLESVPAPVQGALGSGGRAAEARFRSSTR